MYLLAVTNDFKAHLSHIRSKTSASFPFTAEKLRHRSVTSVAVARGAGVYGSTRNAVQILSPSASPTKTPFFPKRESPEGGRRIEQGNKIHKILLKQY